MQNAALGRPKRKTIVETKRNLILELNRPSRSAIQRLVDAKICWVVSNRHQIRDISAEGLYIAKLQHLGAWHHTGCPRLSAIGGDGECAITTARPDDLRVHRPD